MLVLGVVTSFFGKSALGKAESPFVCVRKLGWRLEMRSAVEGRQTTWQILRKNWGIFLSGMEGKTKHLRPETDGSLKGGRGKRMRKGAEE